MDQRRMKLAEFIESNAGSVLGKDVAIFGGRTDVTNGVMTTINGGSCINETYDPSSSCQY